MPSSESSSKAVARLATVSSHLRKGKGVHTQLRDLAPRFEKPLLIPFAHADEPPVSGSHVLSSWSSPPAAVLIVHKAGDARVDRAVGKVLDYFADTYGTIRILVEQHTADAHPTQDLVVIEPDSPDLFAQTDLVITLGGDGTMLHASSLFSQGECPPVLCFSMGSLGFLLPFPIESFIDVLRATLLGPVSILYRMRLACTPLDKAGNVLARCSRSHAPAGWQVMNEVALNRGRHAHLAVLDAYLNDECLTTGIADGLLLSTPTGSTAYNLSSGGPIAHPEADVLLLTPVAPRSLSFRPVVLPGSARVRLQIADRARAPALLSLDGRDVGELSVGESVDVRRSPWPIPCIERGGGPGTGWVKDINSLLLFNTGFVNSRTIRDR